MALPAPLRWLTRAFSSITLAVILLIIVALYGVAGSMPFYFMLIGLIWVGTLVALVAGLVFAGQRIGRKSDWPKSKRLLVGLATLVGGTSAAALFAWEAYVVIDAMPVFEQHRATKVYKLPWLEMNETEFFGWWPLQIVLMLFVVNMVWSTIRRIEFSIPRLGVLTVHTGIVLMALGSVFYSQLKLEGDMFIVRSDLPGARPVSHFYDRKLPAMFVSVDRAPAVQFELPELPRYNDYAIGELDIRLHDKPMFRERLGDDLRITIPGFMAYGELEPIWLDAPADQAPPGAGPALTLALGNSESPNPGSPGHTNRTTLDSTKPAERVLDPQQAGWAIEYLHAPSTQRIFDLMSETPMQARHALLIEVPGHNYREVREIGVGDAFDVGDTGYRIFVEEIGPYGLPFVSEGYQGATDTHAKLKISRPGPVKPIDRYALHRFPERTQDFVDGQRGDPDPGIRTVYLDQSKIQAHLITDPPADFPLLAGVPDDVLAQADGLWVLLRIAGIKPIMSPLVGGKMPMVDPSRENAWVHVVERFERAVRAKQPVITPRELRDPKIEGTYEKALVPVHIEYDLRDENFELTGETFTQTITLRQMPYLEQQGDEMRPQIVSIPTYGNVEISFGRKRMSLPFAVAMTDFAMTPYPGSDIPQDFQSELLIYPVDENGQPAGVPDRASPRMNNPVVHRTADVPLPLQKIKLSQAGWDPGDPTTTPQEKQLRDPEGRFVNQQRFTILGVGNNVGIRIIALGACLMTVGIPYAFYVKPWMMRRRARKLAERISRQQAEAQPEPTPVPETCPTANLPAAAAAPPPPENLPAKTQTLPEPEPEPEPELVEAGDPRG
ncbi:MAG: hypothetical protein AAGH99_16105 [Planctomycetota bacterium]